MIKTLSHLVCGRRLFARGSAVLLALAVLWPVDAAAAGERRARLSRDVSDRLDRGVAAATDVIVSADASAIDGIAARSGARIKRRLRDGAVLEATGAQLDALTRDEAVAHVAGDVPVTRMMAVTTTSTGADQVWSSVSGSRGLTGSGVGVAVIDSGVAPHPALRGHVAISVDFPSAALSVDHDEYGHGTHVAGIIAGTTADGY